MDEIVREGEAREGKGRVGEAAGDEVQIRFR